MAGGGKGKKRAAVEEWNLDEEGPIRIIEGAFHLDERNFDELVKVDGRYFLVFYTVHWCAPCRQVAPFVDGLAMEGKGIFHVGKVNVEADDALRRRMNVQLVPSLVLYRSGEEVERMVGQSPTASGIRRMVRKVLKEDLAKKKQTGGPAGAA